MIFIKNVFYASKLNLLATAIIFVCTTASAQKNEADTLLRKFDQYRIKFSSEKVYAHLDQELYLTGETMWLKLYVVDASLHKPIDISKVAYMEILDKDNRPVLQTKIALRNGFGNGSLFVPASIASGNYTVRAYTSWMKNFSPDFYFHKPITIINTFKKLEIEKPTPNLKPDVQFFPEGGNFVAGLKSKVAFRVINGARVGIAFTGYIINQANDTITSFKPKKFGMGSFEFTPAMWDEYKAVIEDEQGHRNTYQLPAILESGYIMNVKDTLDNSLVIVVKSKLVITPTIPAVYVFIHARNVVSAASVHFLQQGQATIVIPKKDFQDGISHITLFDQSLQPVCERLYFMPVRKKLLIDVKPSQREFGVRRKVSLDLTTQNSNGEPQLSNVSVAVHRLDSLQQKSEDNILNYLWLSSDLVGTIESPAYYLNSEDPEVKLSLDNLMLTHGWRRFNWKSVLNNTGNSVQFVPEYRGHIIRGKVTDVSGAPVRNVTTYLSSPSRNIQVYGSTSSESGEIKYEMKDFNGPRKIISQTNFLRDSTSVIRIESPFSDKFSNRWLPAFSFPQALEKQLITRSIGMQVQDIFYQDKNSVVKINTIDSTSFYGKPDATYYLDDYTRFPVMEEIMREYVPGVLVRKRRDGFHFINLDVVNKTLFNEDPLVLLDGIPIFDIDKIMAFDPLKIKKLEVVTRRHYLGVLSLPGIVSYTTYTGDLGGFQLDPKSVMLDYEGLQLQREFYSPKYDAPKLRDSRLPDQRNLLYWAPEVVITADGKQHIEFYTSDLIGDFQVIVEGLTKDGLSGNGSCRFSVRPFDN
jgi:hypothetical protein